MQERKAVTDLRERIVVLTIALYRVTNLLPRQEPLRWHLRKKADEILAVFSEMDRNSAAWAHERLFSKIDTIASYLSVAQAFRDPDPFNFAVLSREYLGFAEKSRKELRKKILEEKTERQQGVAKQEGIRDIPYTNAALPVKQGIVGSSSHAGNNQINDRQQMIIDRVREMGRIKVSDFYGIFNGVSAKTIQRDLQDLVARNVLRKEGEKRWTVYFLTA